MAKVSVYDAARESLKAAGLADRGGDPAPATARDGYAFLPAGPVRVVGLVRGYTDKGGGILPWLVNSDEDRPEIRRCSDVVILDGAVAVEGDYDDPVCGTSGHVARLVTNGRLLVKQG